jgi:ketosteroid isomerase-like protein
MKLADDDRAAVAQVLTDYYRAFSTLDAQAVGPYFHEPSQLVSVAGVVPTPTRAAVAAAFQPVMDALRARGFAKSELINLHIKPLSAATVIAGGVAVRRKTDGQELERAGVVYVLQKATAGWQRNGRDPRRGGRASSRVSVTRRIDAGGPGCPGGRGPTRRGPGRAGLRCE